MRALIWHAIGIACVGAGVVPAHAAIHYIERFNDYRLSFDDGSDFANTLLQPRVVQTVSADAPGNKATESWDHPLTSTFLSWVGDGNITVSNVSTAATVDSARLTSPLGRTGTATYTAHVAPDGLFLTTGVVGGSHFLQLQTTSPGGVDAGYPYVWQLSIPGDWSRAGTDPGTHELLSINAAWSIEKDFVFDGVNTTFRASVAHYSSWSNINLNLMLYGATGQCSGADEWIPFPEGLSGLNGEVRAVSVYDDGSGPAL